MDRADREAAGRTARDAFEHARSGTSVAWSNPDSGNAGSVTPTRTFQRADGQYCREYQQEVIIDGQPQRSYGTACRQPDGSWQIAR